MYPNVYGGAPAKLFTSDPMTLGLFRSDVLKSTVMSPDVYRSVDYLIRNYGSPFIKTSWIANINSETKLSILNGTSNDWLNRSLADSVQNYIKQHPNDQFKSSFGYDPNGVTLLPGETDVDDHVYDWMTFPNLPWTPEEPWHYTPLEYNLPKKPANPEPEPPKKVPPSN